MHIASGDPITDIADVKRHNMRAILRAIETSGPTSRADLSRATGLSQPTVSCAVDSLLRLGLIREIGAGSSTGGRPPVLLELNQSASHAIGVDLGGTKLRVGIADMAGNVLHRTERPSPRHLDVGADGVMGSLFSAIRQAVAEHGIDWDEIGGIGIGAPGVTCVETGVVSVAPAVGWNETPVRSLFEREFGIPVCVDNDVKAATLAELEFGSGRELGTFVFVAIGTGIGASVVIDGRIHRGCSNAAGEIGYMVIDERWPGSTSREFGCLESLAAAPAITAMAQGVLGRPDAGPEDLFAAARAGNAEALDAVNVVANRLAIAFANIATLVDPRAIVVGGGISHAGDILVDAVRRRVAELVPVKPDIRVSALGASGGLVGAATLAIRDIKERMLGRA